MYRLKIFSSFGKSENCKEVWERLCETNIMEDYGIDKSIYITNDDNYTHVLILNTAMPVIPSHIPKKNVVGLAFEPLPFLGLSQKFIDYAVNNIGKYFIGTKTILPEPFTEHYAYMWHMTPYKSIPEKTKIMSIMVSMKTQMIGHQYRHLLVQRILEERLPIDIYGNGCKYYSSDYGNVKGDFEEREPYQDYMFHICIENMQTNHYFSEKITNPLLAGTTPIYFGCHSIDEYFPFNVLKLSGNIEEDIILLKNILQDPNAYRKNIEIETVKDKIYLLRNLDHIYK